LSTFDIMTIYSTYPSPAPRQPAVGVRKQPSVTWLV
jgi:hypothetical protein